MAKIKFLGDTRDSFNWTSLGKFKSYSFRPGEIKSVADSDVPYLLSFGKFDIVSTPPKENVTVEVKAPIEVNIKEEVIRPTVTVEVKKESPVIEVVVDTPVSVPAPAAVVVEESVGKEEEETDPVDYTSFTKKELMKLCKERGLETFGKRDDLIARIVNDDNSK